MKIPLQAFIIVVIFSLLGAGIYFYRLLKNSEDKEIDEVRPKMLGVLNWILALTLVLGVLSVLNIIIS